MSSNGFDHQSNIKIRANKESELDLWSETDWIGRFALFFKLN